MLVVVKSSSRFDEVARRIGEVKSDSFYIANSGCLGSNCVHSICMASIL